MKFEDILGQNRALRLLKGAIEKERIAGAYLFSGPDRVGKFSTAKIFAAALLCQEGEIDSCGACLACRKIEKNIHPDLIVIQKEGQNIKIDQIRTVKKLVQFGPHEAPYKVLIIEAAEDMSPDAANSFLKILEEPAEKVVFILTSSRPTSLPGTILSRCQNILFNELPENLIKPEAAAADESRSLLERFQQNRGNLVSLLNLSAEVSQLKDQIENILHNFVADYHQKISQDTKYTRAVRIILESLRKLQLRANVRLTLDNMFLALSEV